MIDAHEGTGTDSKKRIPISDIPVLLKKPYLNEYEVAAITGRAVSTLRNERHLCKGLPYHRIGGGRSIRYKSVDVIGYMEGHRIVFTA